MLLIISPAPSDIPHAYVVALSDILTPKVVILKIRTPAGKADDEVSAPLIAHTITVVLQVNNTSSPGNSTANVGATDGFSIV